MNYEDQLYTMLMKIVNRAARAEKMPSTEIMVQKVPAALIDEARALLGMKKETE